MTTAIQATVTRCRNGQSLVVLDSEPFNGMEVRSHDLRVIAQRLSALADMADKLPKGGKRFQPTKVRMGEGENTIDPEISADHIACLEMIDFLRWVIPRDKKKAVGAPTIRAALAGFLARLAAGSNLSGMDPARLSLLNRYVAEANGENHGI